MIPCPWPAALTAKSLADYERVIGKAATAPATAAELEDLPADLSKFRLRPAGGHESGWGTLDHSLPFLQEALHEETVELARQLHDHRDIYFRNGSLNEVGPNRAVRWHRDSSSAAQFEADGVRGEDIEFMHYFHGEQNQGGL